MEIVVWVLTVQLWSDPPPKIAITYKKEYTNRDECMQAKQDWQEKKFKTMCEIKVINGNSLGK